MSNNDTKQQDPAETILNLHDGEVIKLVEMQGWPAGGYLLGKEHVGAIQAAYFAKRPLLVRGDPGLGKSQLAQAIACALKWGLVSATIHYNTSFEDLLFSEDHLERLYYANNPKVNNTEDQDLQEPSCLLEPKKYIRPGKIWQAMAPERLTQFNSKPAHSKPGTVLLIDEIDKADATLPNALLEVLDNRAISVPCLDEPIKQPDYPLFVLITSNEERLLPQAFIRRCAVLDLQLPSNEDAAIAHLIEVYQTHLDHDASLAIDDDLLKEAAQAIWLQRKEQCNGEYLAGTSEFLDVVKALSEFKQQDSAQLNTLIKHLVNKNQQLGSGGKSELATS